MDKGERKALEDINAYGCHVIHVLEEPGHPRFTYSVGIEQSTGRPELIVAGMKSEVAHFMINEYNRRVRDGGNFASGECASGFIEGFDIEFRLVHESHYPDYFGWARWLYKGNAFRVLQAVWPTTAGLWPWEPGASEWYLDVQPLLDQPAR